MNEISELKNVTINLDSQTAERIANQYIHYKYFSDVCAMIVLVLVGLLVWKVVRKLIEDL